MVIWPHNSVRTDTNTNPLLLPLLGASSLLSIWATKWQNSFTPVKYICGNFFTLDQTIILTKTADGLSENANSLSASRWRLWNRSSFSGYRYTAVYRLCNISTIL